MKWLAQIKSKQIKIDQIENFVKELKAQGKTVVFTNGCFDILHKGHVTYLAQAAELGDALIVGINTDESVKRQEKGDERPINELEGRSTVLASLGCVAAVVPFQEDTPLQLIERIVPDVLVKGADYDPLEKDPNSTKYIVGRETVLAAGGQVRAIDLVPGFSTTNIVNKLQK